LISADDLDSVTSINFTLADQEFLYVSNPFSISFGSQKPLPIVAITYNLSSSMEMELSFSIFFYSNSSEKPMYEIQDKSFQKNSSNGTEVINPCGNDDLYNTLKGNHHWEIKFQADEVNNATILGNITLSLIDALLRNSTEFTPEPPRYFPERYHYYSLPNDTKFYNLNFTLASIAHSVQKVEVKTCSKSLLTLEDDKIGQVSTGQATHIQGNQNVYIVLEPNSTNFMTYSLTASASLDPNQKNGSRTAVIVIAILLSIGVVAGFFYVIFKWRKAKKDYNPLLE